MIKMKLTILSAVALGLSLSITPGMASAQKFNSLISNPFVFCSAPKPCRYCQPWRAIYKEICADQKNARHYDDPEPESEEITRLLQKWGLHDAASRLARAKVEQCVQQSGRLEDGYCAAELEDYEAKRLPVLATEAEIDRLEHVYQQDSAVR